MPLHRTVTQCNPPTRTADNDKAAAADFKPFFLPIKHGDKIPRVDYDYHDALKNTWEGLKVRVWGTLCLRGGFIHSSGWPGWGRWAVYSAARFINTHTHTQINHHTTH